MLSQCIVIVNLPMVGTIQMVAAMVGMNSVAVIVRPFGATTTTAGRGSVIVMPRQIFASP